jgi:ATP-dependent DNA helicase RecG
VTTPERFAQLLATPEGARVEFKAAERRYDFDLLARYCVALANEGGGTVVLGVTDGRPRRVIGTAAFPEPGRTEAALYDRLGRRVSAEEYHHDGRRVLLFHVPGRAPGVAWSDRGAYWMRAGDALIPMPDEELRRIHSEIEPDFSAEPCRGTSMADLDPRAIAEFRHRWGRRDGNPRIESWSDEDTLRNAELLQDGDLTNAALLLFGTREALTRHVPQMEIVFEYRATEAAGPAQERIELRVGFMAIHDRIWEAIDRRNDRQSYQDGLFRVDVLTFDEAVIREAVLNAYCHRDYRRGGSVFVRQYPRRLEVTNPGGFPPGVTPENALDQQNPRNRRLAEALGRCGLVERSGQGINLMVERSVRQSKPLPDFSGTTADEVRLTLRGTITDPAFLRFIERLGEERLASFDTRDLLLLAHLQRSDQVPQDQRGRIARLVEMGVVEAIGRGRGARYLLSRRFYAAMGQRGTYTRRRGLDREENKALLLRHLREQAPGGCPMSELQQVLPTKSRDQIKKLLYELRDQDLVRVEGQRRWARWFATDDPS